MHFIDLLSMYFMAIGLIVGAAIGLGVAIALHLFFPIHDLQVAQALLIGAGLIVGGFIGSRFDLERDRKQ